MKDLSKNDTVKAVLNTIKQRRSIRRYKDEPLPREAIAALLEAGRYAPTAYGKQSCHFIVVTDAKALQEIAALLVKRLKFGIRWRPILKLFVKALRDPGIMRLAKRLEEPGRDCIFYSAPCAFFLLAPENEKFGEADCLLAAENVMVAARSMEIGSILVGTGLMVNKIKAAAERLRIPTGYRVHAVVCLGYPEQWPEELPCRRDNLLNSDVGT